VESVTNTDNLLVPLFPFAEYHTNEGALFSGKFEDIIKKEKFQTLKNSVNLIFTSPPFALNTKKRYDNQQGEAYKKWLASYAPIFRDLLAENGSLVIELGNAWEKGQAIMSTLALEALLDLKRKGNFFLCQQFVVNNPARLPSPAQWVTIKRKRVTDSFTNVWWLSKTADPKADNRKVLRPYSDSMLKLLKRGTYDDGKRPSEHVIGSKSFLKDNGGSIPHNVLKINEQNFLQDSLLDFQAELSEEAQEGFAWLSELSNVLEFSNTSSNDSYIKYCKENKIPLHPARMNVGLPTFFIKFLTDVGDLVLDPFAGSNTTGAASESLGRKWLSFEPMVDYINGSKGRFKDVR
jgi:DNA modification methylase